MVTVFPPCYYRAVCCECEVSTRLIQSHLRPIYKVIIIDEGCSVLFIIHLIFKILNIQKKYVLVKFYFISNDRQYLFNKVRGMSQNRSHTTIEFMITCDKEKRQRIMIEKVGLCIMWQIHMKNEDYQNNLFFFFIPSTVNSESRQKCCSHTKIKKKNSEQLALSTSLYLFISPPSSCSILSFYSSSLSVWNSLHFFCKCHSSC